MKSFTKILVLTLLLTYKSASASQLHKSIDSHLDNINRYALTVASSPGTHAQKIQYLDNENLRDSLRDLQNIFKVVSKKKKSTKDLYDSFKEFEDFISHTRDYQYYRVRSVLFANLYQSKVESYSEFIDTSDWFQLITIAGVKSSLRVHNIKERMKNLDLGSERKLRNTLLHGLSKIIKKIQDKPYRFEHTLAEIRGFDEFERYRLIEDTVHELKRDTRRIDYITYPLSNNGVPILESGFQACPIGQPMTYNSAIYRDDNSYSCKVSRCLRQELQDYKYRFNSFRHNAMASITDPVRLFELIKQTKLISDELKEKKVYLHLAAQFKLCKRKQGTLK